MRSGLVLAVAAGLLIGFAPATSAHVSGTDASSGDASFDPSVVARLDAALKESLGALPGGVIAALSVPGKGTWVKTYGVANIKSGARLTPDTQMSVASVTKTFTGTLVLQAVQRGLLKLSEPLSTWYPGIPKADEITVAMLLNMSSGIGDHMGGDTYIDKYFTETAANPRIVYNPEDLIAVGTALPRAFDVPGTAFAYSNTNTVLLARILEKATGDTYQALLHRWILAPMGLDRTELRTTGAMTPPSAQMYTSYEPLIGGPAIANVTAWLNTAGWAAGAILSTLDDLQTWAHALGTGDGVLSRKMQRVRMSQCIDREGNGVLQSQYCLGTGATRKVATGQVITIWHTGFIPGAVSYVGYYPRTRATLVILGNYDANTSMGQNVADTAMLRIHDAVPGLLGLAS